MKDRSHIHVLSRAVIIDQEHILLCKVLEFGFYFLPGGHVEHGESIQTALLRELIEEAGAVCEIKRFLGFLEYSFIPDHPNMCHNHEHNFIFEIESNNLTFDRQLVQLESHSELSWVPLTKLDDLDFRPMSLRSLLPLWLKNAPNNLFQSEINISKET